MSGGYLTDDVALAAIVLWGSGYFDTMAIAGVLHVREDAVCRTLSMARDASRQSRKPTNQNGGGVWRLN